MRKDFLQTEITSANAFISDPALRTEKYNEMANSPAQFYRATAHLYYSDLSNGTINIPESWKSCPETQIWLSGDFHAQNIGFFDNKAGQVVFDLNDADESSIGPFYWDLLRFATSIFLFTEDLAFSCSEREREELVKLFLHTYQETLQELQGNSHEKHIQLDKDHVGHGFIQRKLQKLQEKSTEKLLAEWTTPENGTRTFKPFHKDLAKATLVECAVIRENWEAYQQSLSCSFTAAKGSNYFVIKDIARRLHAGLGSLGVERYYVLIEGEGTLLAKNIILEIKEERQPSLCHANIILGEAERTRFKNEAERALIANQALTMRNDRHLGIILLRDKACIVRRISPYKCNIKEKDFQNIADSKDFVTNAARALALAHARSDRDYHPEYISYSFEQAGFHFIQNCPSFKATLKELAHSYYQQVRSDHQEFKKIFKV